MSLKIIRCPKCGYEWNPRKNNPKACPSCKQYNKGEWEIVDGKEEKRCSAKTD